MSDATLDARDLRMGGRWSAGQRAKNACLRWLVRSALALADVLPRPLLLLVGRALGAVAHALARSARARARLQVARALPERDTERLVRASFVAAGESLATCLLLRRPEVRALDLVEVDEEARRTLRGALASGSGAVVVSAHLGPFELIPAAVAELGMAPAVVVRESYDPALDPMVDSHRAARGIRVIHRGRTGASTRIVRALREGRPVGILPDLGGRVKSRPVQFLGASREFPVGPALLALRAGAPIVTAVLEARPAPGPRFRLVVRAPPRPNDEAALTQCIAFALENAICCQPEGWLWMAKEPSGENR